MPVHVAVRSYFATGVAIVGASAIVAAPISVAPPEIHLPAIHASSAAVELAAFANPITEWVQVVQTTFNNIAALGTQVQSSPAPILQQILTNQLANAQTLATALEGAAGGFVAGITSLPAATLTAAQQLAAGQFSTAVGTLFQAGLGLILAPAISLLSLPTIVTNTVQNFANVVAAIPDVLLPIGLSAISPLAGVVYSFGDTGQAIIDAVRVGDLAGALSALVNAPAVLTNAFLNGYPPQNTVGILSPFDGTFNSGLIATLLNARDVIAQALGAPAPAPLVSAAAELPAATTLVALSGATRVAASSKAPEASTDAAADATVAETTTTEPAATTTEPTEPVVTEPAASATTEPAAGTTEAEAKTGSTPAEASTGGTTSATSEPSSSPKSSTPNSTDAGQSSTSGASSTSTGSGSPAKQSESDKPSSSSTASDSVKKDTEPKKDTSAGSAGTAGSDAS